MSQRPVCILTLLFLCVVQGREFCVEPENGASGGFSDCHSLSFYTQNVDEYFQNNTTFVFLPGTHHLFDNITISADNVAMIGSSTAVPGQLNLLVPTSQIHCPGYSASLTFKKVKNLTLTHLLFSECGGSVDDNIGLLNGHATLALWNVEDIYLSKLVIQNGTGMGVVGHNVQGLSVVTDSALLFNKGAAGMDGGNAFFAYYSSCKDIVTELTIDNSHIYGGFSRVFWVVHSPSGLTLGVRACRHVNITTRNCTIQNNVAGNGWGGNMQIGILSSSAQNPTIVITIENCNILNGRAEQGSSYGGGMYIFTEVLGQEHAPQISIQSCLFSNNTADVGGALYVYGNPANVTILSTTFENNTAHRMGGGVHLDRVGTFSNDIQYFNRFWLGEVTMSGNRAEYGGAISLGLASTITFVRHTTNTFTNNHAERGGSFYTAASAQYATCFVSQSCLNCYQVHMIDNVGTVAGQDVFLERDQASFCILKPLAYTLEQTLHLGNNMTYPSLVTSDTASVHLCTNDKPDFDLCELALKCYPGKRFHVQAITTGYLQGVVPGSVIAEVIEDNATIDALEKTQHTNGCTYLSYTVLSDNEYGNVTLKLHTGVIEDESRVVHLKVNLTGCPNGFQLKERKCTCSESLNNHDITCNVENATILQPRNIWIGFVNNFVLYYPYCPFDFCKSEAQPISLSESYPDTQCMSHRQGVLCSSCLPNSSLALGSNNCLPGCSELHLLLLLPIAIAGIVLVLFLIITDLTISKGCLNAIIFYANIVWMNSSIFLPPNTPKVFTIFLAWINLDLGIETCLYPGMDAYRKAWLQFIFPVYLWAIMFTMYVLSSRSTFFTKLIRKNSIQVLATLFLLSYTKLLRSAIGALSVAYLEYPNHAGKYLWLMDANIHYLSATHIPLFLVGLFFLVLLLPYVLFLTFGEFNYINICNRRKRWHRYSLKIQTFFEAYGGCFRPRRKFWVGALVIARVILLAVFATNYTNEPNINLLATALIALMLTLMMALLLGLYTHWYKDLIEALFIFNLGALSLATYYVQSNRDQVALVSTSVGVTLFAFLGILAVHLYKLIPNKYSRYSWCIKKYDVITSMDLSSNNHTTETSLELSISRSSIVESSTRRHQY